jgi:hypothetical protein
LQEIPLPQKGKRPLSKIRKSNSTAQIKSLKSIVASTVREKPNEDLDMSRVSKDTFFSTATKMNKSPESKLDQSYETDGL